MDTDALVEQVKHLQRSNSQARDAWTAQCNADFDGLLDPARHTALVLETFLAEWSGSEGCTDRRGQIIQEVKDLQRSDVRGRAAWLEHCDEQLGGIYNPAKHDDETLEAFLEWWTSTSGGHAGEAAPSKLIEKVKRLQKSNRKARQAWDEHCQAELGGIVDPAKHRASSLQDFLDWWAVEGDNNDDSPHAQLVKKIKSVQRSSKNGTQAWFAYCDAELDGIYDPARHTVSQLTGFLDKWIAESGECIDEPAPCELVEKLKSLQRSSAEAAQAWTDHCLAELGGLCDPGRHSAPTLQGFLDWWDSECHGAEASHAKYVEKIKVLQRSSAAARQAWTDHCHAELGGLCDPVRHSTSTIKDFLKWWRMEAGATEVLHSELVQQVKDMQRSSQELSEAWMKYCDEELEGMYNPAHHASSALETFVVRHKAKGRRSCLPGDQCRKPECGSSVGFVESGAHLAPQFKDAWEAYCHSKSSISSEPNVCGATFVSDFAHYIGRLVLADLAIEETASVQCPKRPSDAPNPDQPASKKKISIKKSVADEIQRINAEVNLVAPLKLVAVAGPLATLGETDALTLLSYLAEAGEEAGDPNEFVVAKASNWNHGNAEL